MITFPWSTSWISASSQVWGFTLVSPGGGGCKIHFIFFSIQWLIFSSYFESSKRMRPHFMYVLMSMVNEDLKYERWTSEFLLWVLFSPALSSILVIACEGQKETEQQFPQHRKNKTKNPTTNYHQQSRVLYRGGTWKPGGHQACARDTAIPCDLMGGWMVTWLHAHKELQVTSAAFFFQMTRFRPVRRPTLASLGLVFGRPTEAFVSLPGSSFGACR